LSTAARPNFVNSAIRAAEYGFTALNDPKAAAILLHRQDFDRLHARACRPAFPAGVFHAMELRRSPSRSRERDWYGQPRYDLSGIPKVNMYFYITSYLTGDFPLARSDGLVVRLWPVIKAVASIVTTTACLFGGGAIRRTHASIPVVIILRRAARYELIPLTRISILIVDDPTTRRRSTFSLQQSRSRRFQHTTSGSSGDGSSPSPAYGATQRSRRT
jgi:hypothetical protein